MRKTVLLASAAIAALSAAIQYGFEYGACTLPVVWMLAVIAITGKVERQKEEMTCRLRKARKEQEKDRLKTRKRVQDLKLKLSHEKEVREALAEDLAQERTLVEKYREERQRLLKESPRIIFQKTSAGDNWKDPDDIFRGSFKNT